jgi:hypothetical protein
VFTNWLYSFVCVKSKLVTCEIKSGLTSRISIIAFMVTFCCRLSVSMLCVQLVVGIVCGWGG